MDPQCKVRFEPIRVLNRIGSWIEFDLDVQIRIALDRVVDFNEHVTAFTTCRACMPSSDIKGGYCLVPGTAPIRSADASHAR